MLARLALPFDFRRVRRRFGSRLHEPIVIALVWAVVAVAAAIQAVALVRLDARAGLARIGVGAAILTRLAILPVWALATPLILRSARRFPVRVTGSRRLDPAAVAAHLVLGTLFIVVANVIIRLPAALAPVHQSGGVEALVRSTMQGVAEFYPAALVVYGVIVAIGHGLATGTPTPEVSPSATPAASPPSHLTVRQWNRTHLVRLDEIDWIEAQDNYVVVHADARAYKGRDRISDVEVQLDSSRFVRIHRSTIVQIGRIREVQPLTHGDHAVVLRNGTVLRVARSRRHALADALGLQL